MIEPLSIDKCRKSLGESASAMADDDVEKLRDALYSASETIRTEIKNTDREGLWHESSMAHATTADLEALAGGGSTVCRVPGRGRQRRRSGAF